MDHLQIHIANLHWLADFDKFTKINFTDYPFECELCPPNSARVFTTPLDRFLHAVTHHYDFYKMVCVSCRRLYKNLGYSKHQTHRRLHHSDIKQWAKFDYLPYLRMLDAVRDAVQKKVPFDPRRYVEHLEVFEKSDVKLVSKLFLLDAEVAVVVPPTVAAVPSTRVDHPGLSSVVSEVKDRERKNELPLGREVDVRRKRGAGGVGGGGEEEDSKKKKKEDGEEPRQ